MLHEHANLSEIRYMWDEHLEAGHNPTPIKFDDKNWLYFFRCTTVV